MKLWEKYTKEEIEIFFKNSSNPQEFMEKLGYKNGKSAYRDIRKKYPWITYKYKRLEGKSLENWQQQNVYQQRAKRENMHFGNVNVTVGIMLMLKVVIY